MKNDRANKYRRKFQITSGLFYNGTLYWYQGRPTGSLPCRFVCSTVRIQFFGIYFVITRKLITRRRFIDTTYSFTLLYKPRLTVFRVVLKKTLRTRNVNFRTIGIVSMFVSSTAGVGVYS